jgi:hypothetical protein
VILEVLKSGDLKEITTAKFQPDEDAVYIFIATQVKTCFLWFGMNSGVRKQFIAANEARKVKLDTGYKTLNVQHEDAEKDFKKALTAWKKDIKKGTAPAAIIEDQRNRIRKMRVDEERGGISSERIDLVLKKKDVPKDSEVDKIVKKLSKYDSIPNHQRDYLITSSYVFSVIQESENLEIELLASVKDGIFKVEHYLPRFLIEDSRLVAIELWRKVDTS